MTKMPISILSIPGASTGSSPVVAGSALTTANVLNAYCADPTTGINTFPVLDLVYTGEHVDLQRSSVTPIPLGQGSIFSLRSVASLTSCFILLDFNLPDIMHHSAA